MKQHHLVRDILEVRAKTCARSSAQELHGFFTSLGVCDSSSSNDGGSVDEFLLLCIFQPTERDRAGNNIVHDLYDIRFQRGSFESIRLEPDDGSAKTHTEPPTDTL